MRIIQRQNCYNLTYDTVFWFRCLLSSGCGLFGVVAVMISLPRITPRSVQLKLLWGSDFLRYSGHFPSGGLAFFLSFSLSDFSLVLSLDLCRVLSCVFTILHPLCIISWSMIVVDNILVQSFRQPPSLQALGSIVETRSRSSCL